MEPHSTVEASPKESSSHLIQVLSCIIALVTLALPLYITAHYSSSTATDSIPTMSPAAQPPRPLLRVTEGAQS